MENQELKLHFLSRISCSTKIENLQNQGEEHLERGKEVMEILVKNHPEMLERFNIFASKYPLTNPYRVNEWKALENIYNALKKYSFKSIKYTWPISEQAKIAIENGKTLYHIVVKSFAGYRNNCKNCFIKCKTFATKTKTAFNANKKEGKYSSNTDPADFENNPIIDTLEDKNSVTIVYLDERATEDNRIDFTCQHDARYKSRHKMIVAQYSTKMSPSFLDIEHSAKNTDKPFHIGIELECIVNNDNNNYQDNLTQIFKISKPSKLIQLIKYDGSLSSHGIEIITQPMTLNYFKKHAENILSRFRKYAHVDESCGTHMHLDRSYFTSNGLKFFDAICRKFVDELSKECGRSCFNYASFPIKNTYDLGSSYSRYEFVNFSASQTVEFRLLAGTLDPEKIYRIGRILQIIADMANTMGEDSAKYRLNNITINWKDITEKIVINKEKTEPLLELVPLRK